MYMYKINFIQSCVPGDEYNCFAIKYQKHSTKWVPGLFHSQHLAALEGFSSHMRRNGAGDLGSRW